MHPKRRTAPPAHKATLEYRAMWRIIDGAVADCFNMHPNYAAPDVPKKKIRASIVKRVTGAVLAAPRGAGVDGDNAT